MSEATTTSGGEIPTTVNGNIRAEAARRGIKLSEIADALGMHSVSLHRRMTGAVSWNLAELEAVADRLGVTLVELLAPARAVYPPTPAEPAPTS